MAWSASSDWDGRQTYNERMAMPLLATKLYPVRPRPQLVTRQHLLDRLNEGSIKGRKLTVLAAPAGFGKTTLLSEWVAGQPRSVAWLSLDENDNDPERFITYVAAALQTQDAGLGAEALSLVRAGQAPLGEPVLTALLNAVARSPHDLLLVLDDYHQLLLRPIHDAVTFLIDHLPGQLQVAIASRSDPPLPLPRLRARGDLTELRAADLRFTPGEAAAFLNEVMGLTLSAEDVAALETRTEGWIAGLQLAALSMQGRQDVSPFIQAFAGDHRYIADYLVEEVLQRQPASVRRFLLETSILDQLTGALCDAVTGQVGGGAQLEALERGNLFVIPLDDRRMWFRYHHLFAEMLRSHLRAELPEQVATLHGRASQWFEHTGSVPDAIRHALAAGDHPRAAELIEKALPDLRRDRHEATLLAWLRALPDDLLRDRPVLSFAFAGVLMQTGQFDGVETRLADAERWLEDAAQYPGRRPPGMVVVDEPELLRLPGAVSVHRAAFALVHGDLAGALRHARRALDVVADDDHLGKGSASALLGLAAWTHGDLEEARRLYVPAITWLQRAGHLSDMLGCALTLADIQVEQGHLRDAMRTFQEALQASRSPGAAAARGTADMYIGLSDLHREHNDLATAVECLQAGQALGDHMGLPRNPSRRRMTLARIKQAQGDLESALQLFDEAERLYDGDFSPNVRPVAAWKARINLAQGRLGDAVAWARERHLSPDDELDYLREFEHLTLARVLLAQARDDRHNATRRAAQGLLDRLERAAEAGGRVNNLIEVLILQALALQTHEGAAAALAPLDRALTLAEPEGYVRIFLDEGVPMADLLRAGAAARGQATGYAGRLLSAVDPSAAPALPDRAPTQLLAEPLSERELEVLRLLNTELSGPEIARQLVVSLNTFNTHTRNIYGKLGVNNRRAAVRRAEELRLI